MFRHQRQPIQAVSLPKQEARQNPSAVSSEHNITLWTPSCLRPSGLSQNIVVVYDYSLFCGHCIKKSEPTSICVCLYFTLPCGHVIPAIFEEQYKTAGAAP